MRSQACRISLLQRQFPVESRGVRIFVLIPPASWNRKVENACLARRFPAVGWLMVLTLLARCFTEAILPALGLRMYPRYQPGYIWALFAGYWMVACTPFGTAQYHSDTLRHAYCFKFVIKSIRLKDMNLKACCLWFTSFIYDGIKKTAYNIRNPMPGIACNGGRYISSRHW